MSRASAKKPGQTARSAEKNYKLFAANFHGHLTQPIRDEFIKRVRTGIRRPIFVIDLDEEMKNLKEQVEKGNTTLGKRSSRKKGEPDILSITLDAIENCRKTYDEITRQIEREKAFDLLVFWKQNADAKVINFNGKTNGKTKKFVSGKSLESLPTQTKRASKTGKNGETRNILPEMDLNKCPYLTRKEHNIVGRGELLSKRKYIQDEPENSKLFIVIIGQMTNQFYVDLLQRGEPLQAIINFLPGESGYDLLKPTPQHKEFFIKTIEEIQIWIYELRQKAVVKPTGIFSNILPTISICLAQKFSQEIFDQMSWLFYDIEILYRDYINYYFKPFIETNVSMDKSIQLLDVYASLQSLGMQGHFLKYPIPAVGTDLGTITMYLDSILSTFDAPNDTLTEIEILILQNNISYPLLETVFDLSLEKLQNDYKPAFSSITKFKKYERLFLDDTNELLCSELSFADQVKFINLYYSCLEYFKLRQYVLGDSIKNAVFYHKYDVECEPKFLPTFVKFFPSEEGVTQHLNALLNDYDEYTVDEIYPKHKLYIFKRNYNEIYESEKMVIIPTRLCFRDFTLFQMEEFIRDCITLTARTFLLDENLSEESTLQAELERKGIHLDPMIFICPNSLKARLLSMSEDIDFETFGSIAENFEKHEKPEIVQGLPIGHYLLKGYNLEDIRQEMLMKTSKYHFEEGYFKLYQERWCFTDMNKYLEICINQNRLILNWLGNAEIGVSRIMSLTTKNDIYCRIFGTPNDCSQVLLNYPNGLMIYYQEKYAVQIWSIQESFNQEYKRTYTPFGAIIVHYHEADMILIMRYNGEVYRLYQYEFPFGDEEEEVPLNDLNNTPSNSLFNIEAKSTNSDICNKSNRRVTIKESDVSILENKPNTDKIPTKEKSLDVASNKSLLKLKKSDIFSENWSQMLHMSASAVIVPSQAEQNKPLKEVLANELKFLGSICAEYKLNYLHLIVTTAIGRVVNVTSKGVIFETHQLENIEWHDYNVNESYSMREDGVKRIWTSESLICFHTDGTIFTTKTEESIEFFDYMDYDIITDPLITESSSHEQVSEEQEIILGSIAVTDFAQETTIGAGQTALDKLRIPRNRAHKFPTFIDLGEGFIEIEGEDEEDRSYVNYSCDSFLMQHERYAAVYILLLRNFADDVRVFMEINAADDIRIQINRDKKYEEDKEEDEEEQSEATQSDMKKNVVNVWVEDDYHLCITEDCCDINTIMLKYDAEMGPISETLQLQFLFEDYIKDIFQNFVTSISDFKNYSTETSRANDKLFIERFTERCESQGFEFYDELPIKSQYVFAISNTITELTQFRTVNEKMSNFYDWIEPNLNKFPRFQARKKPDTFEGCKNYPMVFTVNVFIQVPRRLQSTDEIHKFMAPCEKITYKRLRPQMKEAMEDCLRPRVKKLVKIIWSRNNWKLRHEEHKRRLFIEQQRKGLYFAMLKHKAYPKYFIFIQNYFGQAKYIDFFEFITHQCMKNIGTLTDEELAILEEEEKLAEERERLCKYKLRKQCKEFSKFNKCQKPPADDEVPVRPPRTVKLSNVGKEREFDFHFFLPPKKQIGSGDERDICQFCCKSHCSPCKQCCQ